MIWGQKKKNRSIIKVIIWIKTYKRQVKHFIGIFVNEDQQLMDFLHTSIQMPPNTEHLTLIKTAEQMYFVPRTYYYNTCYYHKWKL